MILKTERSIPQVYGKERTIQVFTNLLDTILNCCKFDIDNLGSIYDANTCPEMFLPYLAKTLNYSYNFGDTVSANRRIIKVFVDLEKKRGSQDGLKIATALCLSSEVISAESYELSDDIYAQTAYMQALKDIDIVYDYEQALIKIKYKNVYNVVRNLLDYVRPVGMWLELVSETGMTINADALLIYADTESKSVEYIPEIDSFVSKSKVNFSTTGDPTFKEQLINFMDSINLNDNTLDMNGGD